MGLLVEMSEGDQRNREGRLEMGEGGMNRSKAQCVWAKCHNEPHSFVSIFIFCSNCMLSLDRILHSQLLFKLHCKS